MINVNHKNGMEEQKNEFAAETIRAQAVMAPRIDDHLAWFQSAALVQALAVYDQKDETNGWCYAGQTGLCILGTEGIPAVADALAGQWQDNPLAENNLALRGFACNQQDILQELAETREKLREECEAEIKAKSPEGVLEHMLKFYDRLKISGKLIEKFEKLAKAYGVRQGDLPFTQLTAAAHAWFASLSTQVLRYNFAKKLDFFFPLYRNWLAASVDREMLGILAREKPSSLSSLQRQLHYHSSGESRTTRDLRMSQINSHKNDFYKVRAASFVLIFEAVMLIYKGAQMPEEDKGKWLMGLTGQILTIGVAGIELINVGIKQLLQLRTNQTTKTGAENLYNFARQLALVEQLTRNGLTIGALKLSGAALVNVGAIVLAWGDKKTGGMLRAEGDSYLARAYYIRFTATVALSLGQLGVAIASAEALFLFLNHRFSGYATKALLVSSRILSIRSVALLLGRLNAISLVLITVISIGIFVFSDSNWIAWCKRSTYRGDTYRGREPYKNLDEELKAFFTALNT